MRHDELDAVELGQPLAERAAGLGPRPHVERSQRLVEQQQRRLNGQRARQRDALRLPAGQLCRPRAGVIGQADAPQPIARLPCVRSPRAAPRQRRPKATLSSALRCGNSR